MDVMEMKTLYSVCIWIVVYFQVLWVHEIESFSCEPPNSSSSYITSARLLIDDTEQLRVKSSTDECFLWNLTSYESTQVSCSDYGAEEQTEWSTGDTDSTNSSVSTVTVSPQVISIGMDRNNANFGVNMSNTFYNDTTHDDMIFGFWTLNSLNTTMIIVTSNNASHPTKVFSVEFTSQTNNSVVKTEEVIFTVPFKPEWITSLSNLGEKSVYVFEQYGLLNFQVQENSCTKGRLYSYELHENTDATQKILNLTKIGSAISMDTRIESKAYGYYWEYSNNDIKIYQFIEDSDGSLLNITGGAVSLAVTPKSPNNNDIDLYWGFIIMGCVLVLIALYSAALYWYSEKKAKMSDDDDDDD